MKATTENVYSWLKGHEIRLHSTLNQFVFDEFSVDKSFMWNPETKTTSYDTLLILSFLFEVWSEFPRSCSLKTMAKALRLALMDDKDLTEAAYAVGVDI